MPHVSRKKLSKKSVQDLEERLMLFLSTTSVKTRQEIFRELLTETEHIMLAKRLTTLYLLNEQKSVHEIHDEIGISPSTGARYENALKKGKFTHTCSWLKNNKKAHSALRLIADLVAVPFEAQHKSLGKVIEEHY